MSLYQRLIAFSLLVLCGCVSSHLSNSSPEAAIRNVLDEQVQQWNAGNLPAFMEGYAKASKTRFASGGTVQMGWEQVFQRYQARYGNRQLMGKLTFSDVDVALISSDAALVFGRWQLQREQDKPSGLFSLIFRKLPEGWRIVHDHTSSSQ